MNGFERDIDAFERLKPRLADLWRSVFPRDDQHYTSVVVPSLTLDTAVLALLPGEDGHALIRRVRSLGPEAGGDVPAIALTSYVRPEDRVQAVRAGFQVHLAKPVDPSALVALVASLARRG